MVVVKLVTSILAACAISSAAEDVLHTSAPSPVSNQTAQPTYYPTYWPTYTPTAAEELPEEAGAARRSVPSVRCPDSFESYVEIDNLASMQYSIVKSDDPLQSGFFCARLFVNNTDDGWVAIAFSQDGSMAGSDAVVADLEQESVLKYHLGGRDPTGVVLMEEAKQTLQNTLVGIYGTFAVVEFTKLLVEENEVTINEDGINIFLHARGDNVWPGYHASRTVFVDVVKKKTLSIVCDETRPCPEGEYCKLEPGKCFDAPDTQVGVCTRIHDNCNWPVDYLPVCGCDQQTYGNACEVDEFGTSVAYEGFCELNERQVDPIDSTLSCPEKQCLDPDGKCDAIVSCIIDPCDVQNECAFAECEANYCGGCHHVCNGNFTKVSDEINCLAEWAPVCGEDDITYSNSCEASKVNATILYEGECNATAIPILLPEEKCSPGGKCSAGSSCSVGTETCCGQTYDSLKCDCVGGSWMCMHTDSCLFPSCCAAGPPKDKPAPSMDFCVPGLACDTGLEDDYCCNDFMNPGITYCTQSGGMPKPEDSLPPVTTEPTITAITTSATTTSSMTTSATTTNSNTFETDSSTISQINSTSSPTSASTAISSSTTPPNQVQATSTEGTTTTSTASAVTSTSTTSDLTTSGSTTSEPPSTTLPETTSSATNSTTTTAMATTEPQTISTDSTEDSTTTTANTTTTPQPTNTSSTISVTLDNSVTTTTSNNIDWDNLQESITQMQSTLAAEVESGSSNTTSSTSATSTSSTIAPSTTTAYNFTLDFSTTAPEARSGLEETTTEATTTTTEPTQLGVGTVEGRPNSPDSSTSTAEKNVVRLSLSSVCLMLVAWNLM